MSSVTVEHPFEVGCFTLPHDGDPDPADSEGAEATQSSISSMPAQMVSL